MNKIQLSIPEPCQQNWEDMTPTEQGRFCNACAKPVIDFSQMSDTAVLNYFSIEKNNEVCGRAYPDQLNRAIVGRPAKKISWRWNYAIAFFLLFSKSNKAKAQAPVTITMGSCTKKSKQLVINNSLEQLRQSTHVTIKGSIQTTSGQAVPFASIKLVHSNHGVATDAAGKFLLDIESIPCIIEISALGYETRQVPVNDSLEKNIVLAETSVLLGEVVVTASTPHYLQSTVGGLMVTRTTVRRNFIKDTIARIFSPAIKIYPNPIMQGNAFTVGLNLTQTGAYTIQIINPAGSVLLERKIKTVSKKHHEQLVSSKTWSSGNYYVRVIDAKGKHIVTGNMVVQ